MNEAPGRRGESARLLEGNGAALVRERAVAEAVQRALERLYQLDRLADVDEFLEEAPDGERETLFVREAADGVIEMALRVPRLGAKAIDLARDADLDPLCQIIEGVSHFVYLSHRARADREATQLELELQAEVDKFVVLAAWLGEPDATASATLRRRLYEDVSYAHDESTEHGDRYRLANVRAHAFVRRLEREYMTSRRWGDMRAALRRFYRVGQEEKLRIAVAA
ncbi:MAG: hypothetical protein ACLQVI_39385 [Polyangiaceae bacterium]